MSKRSPTICISAAEASGDAHAARLIEALRERIPEARFIGIGGPKMIAAGCEPLLADMPDITRQASMVLSPLVRLGYYYRMVKRLQRAIAQIRPDIHIPVDSPALNWHLAKAARQIGAKVVYYIAPQVWAWAPWRVKKLKRLTDHVACILPFEQDWLRSRGVSATYVGHPLFDSLDERSDLPPDLISAWAEGNWNVVLLPGSRPVEIRNHARAMGAVGSAIVSRFPDATCTFAAGDQESADLIRKSLREEDLPNVQITASQTHQVLAASHFAITASGSITLEVAHFGVPMVILYRAGRLVYAALSPILLRTPHLSLVNILGSRAPGNFPGKRIVPELMPWYGSVRELTDTVLEVMDDLGALLEMRERIMNLTEPLRVPPPASASGNAADLIVAVLNGNV